MRGANNERLHPVCRPRLQPNMAGKSATHKGHRYMHRKVVARTHQRVFRRPPDRVYFHCNLLRLAGLDVRCDVPGKLLRIGLRGSFHALAIDPEPQIAVSSSTTKENLFVGKCLGHCDRAEIPSFAMRRVSRFLCLRSETLRRPMTRDLNISVCLRWSFVPAFTLSIVLRVESKLPFTVERNGGT